MKIENISQNNTYYEDFAKRVYMIAELEGWNKQKTMTYFNDRKAFEKFFSNYVQRFNGQKKEQTDKHIPNCVKRLMMDSFLRQEKKFKDEKAREERLRQEEESVLLQSKIHEKQVRKNH